MVGFVYCEQRGAKWFSPHCENGRQNISARRNLYNVASHSGACTSAPRSSIWKIGHCPAPLSRSPLRTADLRSLQMETASPRNQAPMEDSWSIQVQRPTSSLVSNRIQTAT